MTNGTGNVNNPATSNQQQQQMLESAVQGSNANLPGQQPVATSSVRVMGNILPSNLERLH